MAETCVLGIPLMEFMQRHFLERLHIRTTTVAFDTHFRLIRLGFAIQGILH